MGNASSGGWENCMAGEYLRNKNLFFNNFTKMVSFL
jgi:hypothetical protein